MNVFIACVVSFNSFVITRLQEQHLFFIVSFLKSCRSCRHPLCLQFPWDASNKIGVSSRFNNLQPFYFHFMHTGQKQIPISTKLLFYCMRAGVKAKQAIVKGRSLMFVIKTIRDDQGVLIEFLSHFWPSSLDSSKSTKI